MHLEKGGSRPIEFTQQPEKDFTWGPGPLGPLVQPQIQYPVNGAPGTTTEQSVVRVQSSWEEAKARALSPKEEKPSAKKFFGFTIF